VIIPVYNVEKYLRECLDSVVNQTMREIQIICVNDGSPDGSPAILDEYAAKDDRIFIINKENGGLSSARNAAYPYIKGKYTLFVDSDDYIDLTLCEKTFAEAEKKQADMTFFSYHRISSVKETDSLNDLIKAQRMKDFDARTLLELPCSAWSKLWRTKFLLDKQIFFPVGINYEDIFSHWKSIIYAPKFAFVLERLYFYRNNPVSITKNKHVFNSVIPVYNCIKTLLLQTGKYSGEWKCLFLRKKLSTICVHYIIVHRMFRQQLLKEIKGTFNDDDADFLELKSSVRWPVKAFYDSLRGSKIATVKYVFFAFFYRLARVVNVI
jgi:glycosyltransferase involved in cell wall biosynthesis